MAIPMTSTDAIQVEGYMALSPEYIPEESKLPVKV
jgi:hypothetical protein